MADRSKGGAHRRQRYVPCTRSSSLPTPSSILQGRLTAVLTAAAGAAFLAIPAGTAGAASQCPALARQDAASAACPWVTSHAPIAQRVAQVMSQMTVPDEITMVEGQGTTNPYVFYMAGIPSLCIPSLGEEDGPNGVADGLTGVTELPAGVALAAAFDPSLAGQYGQVIVAEEVGKGASVNLGPTINIDRDPRWGRSFETYTEDPYLNAALATSEIDGVPSQGELDQVKHFAVYNQETYRNTPSDDVIILHGAPYVALADVARAERGHGLAHLVVAAVPEQPAGRLGHLGAQRQPDERGDGAQAEHQPPAHRGRAAREGAEDDERDDVGDQDANGDHPLLQHRQRPAPVLGRVFGDVGGGDRGVRADGQADQRAR